MVQPRKIYTRNKARKNDLYERANKPTLPASNASFI